MKPVWTVRKSLIPIAPATLARTSVQEQNRQAERNAGEQHEFARSLCASYESRRRDCISRFLRSWRKLRHLHIKTESRRGEWMFRCLWAGWLHIEVIRLVPHERVQQQTVEVTRLRIMKEAVSAVTLFSFERLQQRTVEQVADLSRFREETVEVVRLAQRERVHRASCGSASATKYIELSMSEEPC